jgi:hypothetical protein
MSAPYNSGQQRSVPIRLLQQSQPIGDKKADERRSCRISRSSIIAPVARQQRQGLRIASLFQMQQKFFNASRHKQTTKIWCKVSFRSAP